MFFARSKVKLPKLFWSMNHHIYDVYFVFINSAVNLFLVDLFLSLVLVLVLEVKNWLVVVPLN